MLSTRGGRRVDEPPAKAQHQKRRLPVITTRVDERYERGSASRNSRESSHVRVISIDDTPIGVVPYANAGREGPETRELPVLAGKVDRLPAGVESIVVTADLQGREPGAANNANARLIGDVLPSALAPILVAAGLPPLSRAGAILAGDLYTVPFVSRRGGTGDVTSVFESFASACRWVAGVAGNHDTFGGLARPQQGLASSSRIHLLDGTIVTIGGIRFGGVFGALGNPKRPNAYTEEIYISMVIEVLAGAPDVFILHDGPDTTDSRLGRAAIREALEVCASDQPGLVIRGHAWWRDPLAELDNRIQVLNVDSRVLILTLESHGEMTIRESPTIRRR